MRRGQKIHVLGLLVNDICRAGETRYKIGRKTGATGNK